MSATGERPLGLFEGYGIEIEYMIVDRETLAVRPVCDRLIEAVAGEVTAEIERGRLAWSNELVMHVIELKTNGPSRSARDLLGLDGLGSAFHAGTREIDALLEPHGARLMPTAMHPFFDPARETKLWPHEYGPVYRRYDAIFDCRGHGWSNLQSTHVNLPFADDAEFARLHAAIRLVLPLLPALAASSPIVEGELTGSDDNRMRFYRGHTARIPSVSGAVVPEPMSSRAAYEGELLGRIWADLAPHDPEGILRHEWVNARGAIARFDRMAIEIRVIDVQERPSADLAVAAAAVAAVRALVEERWAPREELDAVPTEALAELLWRTVETSDRARVDRPEVLAPYGLDRACTAGELWTHLVEATVPSASEHRAPLATILQRGSLARRIRARLGAAPARRAIEEVYRELCDCLAADRGFDP